MTPPVPSTHAPFSVPHELDRVVLRCLEKDPSRRFESAAELDAALADCSEKCSWRRFEAEAWWASRGEHIARCRDTWGRRYGKPELSMRVDPRDARTRLALARDSGQSLIPAERSEARTSPRGGRASDSARWLAGATRRPVVKGP